MPIIGNFPSGGGESLSLYEYAVAGGYCGTEEEFQAMMGTGPWIPTEGRLLENGNEVFNDSASQLIGINSHVEGYGHSDIYGAFIHVEGQGNSTYCKKYIEDGVDLTYDGISANHIEGAFNNITNDSLGYDCNYNHIEGMNNFINVSDQEDINGCTRTCHIEGSFNSTIASDSIHIEGSTNSATASRNTHIGGSNNTVNNTYDSIILGSSNTVDPSESISYNVLISGYSNNIKVGVGQSLFVTGRDNNIEGAVAIPDSINILGNNLYINTSYLNNSSTTIIGEYNNGTQLDGFLIVGGGGSNNCFRVTATEVFGGAYKSFGADYAEMFEWLDGNSQSEDRVGRFVTLRGTKIELAKPGEDFILGIVSATPSVVGDVYDDQWHGKNKRDVFGRYIWEEVLVPDEIREIPARTRRIPDPDNKGQFIEEVIEEAHSEVIRPAYMKRVLLVNPTYDPSKKYVPRSERKEWDAVGMMGKLVMVDDGTCQVDGWCTSGHDGVATNSKEKTRYRVMARLDESHIQILVV